MVAITTSIGANNGILARDQLAMEEAREIDTVIFDKTGTLTKGEFGVVAMTTTDSWDEDQALALTAAIERDSEHMIARGIRQTAESKDLSLPSGVSDFEAIKGRGVRAEWDGQTLYVGGPRLLEMLKLELPEKLAGFHDERNAKGLSRASYRKMSQNLVWATGYNIVAIPLAAGILAPIGILLSPAIGALLMSFSTVIVAVNAQLLRRAEVTG